MKILLIVPTHETLVLEDYEDKIEEVACGRKFHLHPPPPPVKSCHRAFPHVLF